MLDRIFIQRKRNIGNEAVYLTISKITSTAISLAVSMLLSRFRTLEEYGTYSQLLIVTNLFSSVFMLGLPSSINYFLARSDSNEDRTRFLSIYYCLTTCLCVIMGISLVFSIPLIELYFGNESISHFCYFLALYPWTIVINSSIENILIVYQKTRFLLLYRFLYGISVIGMIFVAYRFEYSFWSYVQLFLVVNVIFAISSYVISFSFVTHFYFFCDRYFVRRILSFSIPIGLSQLVGTLNVEIDKLLIGYLLTTDQLAIYTNASKELPFAIISASFTSVLMPKLVLLIKEKNAKDAIVIWGYSIILSYSIIAFGVSIVIVFSKEIIAALYSQKYLPGISVFRIYALSNLLRCTYFGIILNSSGYTKKILYCAIGSLGLNMVLNPLLYSVFGMEGPAVATLLSILILAIVQLKMTSKVTNINFREVFPWREIRILTYKNTILATFFGFVKLIINGKAMFLNFYWCVIILIIWILTYYLIIRKSIVLNWKKLSGYSL